MTSLLALALVVLGAPAPLVPRPQDDPPTPQGPIAPEDEGDGADVGDWPGWRGPEGDGGSRETGWHVHGLEEPLWRADVGLGYSSTSVVGERLLTAGYLMDGGVDVLWCLDAETGAEIWSRRFPARRWNDQHTGGTNSTPVVSGERVVSVDREGRARVLALATGEILWTRDLTAELELGLPTWGFAATPVVSEGRIHLNLDRVVALELDTGELAWQSEPFGDTYSTPGLFELGGVPCLAALVRDALVVLRRGDGELLHTHPFSNALNAHAASPVVVDGRLFVSSGYDRGAALYEPTDEGLREVWASRVMRNKVSTSVLWQGHLYGFDEGVLKCIDLAGEERWRQRGLGRGALLVADGKLVLSTARGELVIADAAPDGYRELALRPVLPGDGVHWTAPVLSRGRIYVRDSLGRLVCLDHRSEGPVLAARAGAPSAVTEELEDAIASVTADELAEVWREDRPPPEGDAFLALARGEGLLVAAALFRTVRAGDPGYVPFAYDVWRDRVWYELSQGRAREAWIAGTLLVEAYPERADSFRRLADACVALHDTGRAIELFRRALALDPGNRYVQGRLEELAE